MYVCPPPLRKFTEGSDEVAANGDTIMAMFDDLEQNHPGIKERIMDETGKVRRFVNVYVNGDDIRLPQERRYGVEGRGQHLHRARHRRRHVTACSPR